MKKIKLKLFPLVLIFLSFSSHASAQIMNRNIHTEDNELVCQMNDFMETKIFVDSDYTLDKKIGELSSKILEIPTKNAHGNNNRLFQVKLVKVFRARCPDCRETQTILYNSDGVGDIINKLEVSSTKATLTLNVKRNGEPKNPSFVFKGQCEPNEVE